MPCIESLSITRWDGERRHLALCKAERFGIVNVLPEKGVDLVGILSAVRVRIGRQSVFLVRVSLQSLQRRREEGTENNGICSYSNSKYGGGFAERRRSRRHDKTPVEIGVRAYAPRSSIGLERC